MKTQMPVCVCKRQPQKYTHYIFKYWEKYSQRHLCQTQKITPSSRTKTHKFPEGKQNSNVWSVELAPVSIIASVGIH